jgi:hypothetical protein
LLHAFAAIRPTFALRALVDKHEPTEFGIH